MSVTGCYRHRRPSITTSGPSCSGGHRNTRCLSLIMLGTSVMMEQVLCRKVFGCNGVRHESGMIRLYSMKNLDLQSSDWQRDTDISIQCSSHFCHGAEIEYDFRAIIMLVAKV